MLSDPELADGRRHAAVSNLQVAVHYAEERRLASWDI